MTLYQVSRWVEQTQIVDAFSPADAIDIAVDTRDWDQYGDAATKEDNLYRGYEVIEVKE